MVTAAQDQALRTNSIKAGIDKQNMPLTCRVCGEGEEIVSHIVAQRKMLAQKHYVYGGTTKWQLSYTGSSVNDSDLKEEQNTV